MSNNLTITYDMNTVKADFFESEGVRSTYEQMEDTYAVEGTSVKDIHGWSSFTEYFNDLLWPVMKDHLTEEQLVYIWYGDNNGVNDTLQLAHNTLSDYLIKDQTKFLKANETEADTDERT